MNNVASQVKRGLYVGKSNQTSVRDRRALESQHISQSGELLKYMGKGEKRQIL